jgi:hypothetical protein
MADYLVFQTQQAAQSALEVIYANMVAAISSPDLLNVATGQVVDKDDLTPDEAVQVNADQRQFPVFGVNAATGIKDTAQGFTTAWATAQETILETWVFQKPDDALMDGVSDYTVEPYDPAWFPVKDIVNGL